MAKQNRSKTKSIPLEVVWQRQMADYVTAIAWTPDGSRIAACSDAGEVVLYDGETGDTTVLQDAAEQSVDTLAISPDGRFLAAGGQSGTVWIWSLGSAEPELVSTLDNPRVWIDQLHWHPVRAELAFSLGHYVQVWDAIAPGVITTLDFEASSVLDMTWNPDGDFLLASGNQGVKVWVREDWDADPRMIETGAPCGAIAWSPNGQYLASGNNDCTLLVWEWGNAHPWRMRGFPGKVQELVWSMPTTKVGAPMLASMSADRIITWSKDEDAKVGWNAQPLEAHTDRVTAIAFQPNSFVLASAAEDGQVYLWKANGKSAKAVQCLQGADEGFSCLSWHPQGKMLAAGGAEGEIVVWASSKRGAGFG